MNVVLGLIAALLWGTAYGSYFAPDIRRWLRRKPPVVAARLPLPPQRRPTARAAPRPWPQQPAPPPAQAPAAPSRSNVVPFRRPIR